MIEILKAIFFGIIQGITEWLPISSTGHMILANEFLHLNGSAQFVSTFLVVIQFGSILAVLMLYFEKLNPFSKNKDKKEKDDTFRLWIKVLIAVIPSGIIGVLFEEKIDALFFNSFTIAITLILYGVIMIWIESKDKKPQIKTFKQISIKTALLIGMFQCLALIPGTSRSGSTIIGAMLLGTSRFVAAEFSFFLAIPTMLGASLLKLVKAGLSFTSFEWFILFVGSVVSFVVSVVVIKMFITYIKEKDFKPFGIYRIILGLIIIATFVINK